MELDDVVVEAGVYDVVVDSVWLEGILGGGREIALLGENVLAGAFADGHGEILPFLLEILVFLGLLLVAFHHSQNIININR